MTIMEAIAIFTIGVFVGIPIGMVVADFMKQGIEYGIKRLQR